MTFSTTTISGRPNGSPLTGSERVPMDQGTQTIAASTAQIAGLATKQTVGLGNVDNTSDADKPISTATAAALAAKADAAATTAALASKADAAATTTALAGKVSNSDPRLTDSRSPTSHAATHATSGADAITPASIGAATAAQGALAATAVQPAVLADFVQTSDGRLSDSREWSAATITQAEAEAGVGTTRRAFTAQRIFQAAAAWWAATASATGQALATAASAAAARTTLGLGSLATQSGTFSGTSSGTNTGDQDLSGLLVKASNLSDLANAATARTNLGLGSAATAATSDFLPTTFTSNTITYAADVELDMAALNGSYRTISLTGPLSLTSINRAAGRTVTLRLICDATQRALTFPAGWVFVGTKPSNIAASKTAILSISFFGTASTDAVAAYGVQS